LWSGDAGATWRKVELGGENEGAPRIFVVGGEPRALATKWTVFSIRLRPIHVEKATFRKECTTPEFFHHGDVPLPWDVDFEDSRHGWLSFDTGDVFRCQDGGLTWCQATVGKAVWPDPRRPRGFQVLHFHGNHGVGLSFGEVLATLDGGRSWTRIRVPEGIYDLHFFNKTEGWALAFSHRLYRVQCR
jgi:hypothetical protein